MHTAAATPDHGLSCKSVPSIHVEDAKLVHREAPDECKTVDGPVLIDGYSVDKRCEGQAVAQGECNNAGAGQQSLRGHMHFGHLHHADQSGADIAVKEHCLQQEQIWDKTLISSLDVAMAHLRRGYLGELPHGIHRFVVQAEICMDAIGIC